MSVQIFGNSLTLDSIEELDVAAELQRIAAANGNTLPAKFSFNRYCKLSVLRNMLVKLGFKKENISLTPANYNNANDASYLEASMITAVSLQ